MEQKSAEVTTEWSLACGRNGLRSLASIQPGGTVTFERRNIKGLNRSLAVSISSGNFYGPQLATELEFPSKLKIYDGCLHGHYGGCLGDLPSYDPFPLGGPYSVRGYNMGELGACRNKLEVDQGLGIGSKCPFFNRRQLTLTGFIPLKKVEEGDRKPLPTLVLHGHYGGCLCDLRSYDAFPFAGPYSVRGYNMGPALYLFPAYRSEP